MSFGANFFWAKTFQVCLSHPKIRSHCFVSVKSTTNQPRTCGYQRQFGCRVLILLANAYNILSKSQYSVTESLTSYYSKVLNKRAARIIIILDFVQPTQLFWYYLSVLKNPYKFYFHDFFLPTLQGSVSSHLITECKMQVRPY